jgi:hypothetical protein
MDDLLVNEAEAPPSRVGIYVAHLDGDLAAVPSALGSLTDALLADRARYVLFVMGKNATDAALLGAIRRWEKRNEANLRTRARASATVIPRLVARLQWRLANLFLPSPISAKVVATQDAGHAFLEAQRRKGAHHFAG